MRLRSGEIDDAEKAFSDAVNLNRNQWSLWAHWAIAALHNKQWDQAIERLVQADGLCSRMQARPILMMLAEMYKIMGAVCILLLLPFSDVYFLHLLIRNKQPNRLPMNVSLSTRNTPQRLHLWHRFRNGLIGLFNRQRSCQREENTWKLHVY